MTINVVIHHFIYNKNYYPCFKEKKIADFFGELILKIKGKTCGK